MRPSHPPRPPLSILYATASGNAEQLAELAAGHFAARGWDASAANLAGYPAARLRGMPLALIIASTWGDGEPPPDAADFVAALRAPEPLGLAGLRYAVLALGSSMYPAFCACGREIDARLAVHGAQRLIPRVDADTKYLADFRRWLGDVTAALDHLP
jgi:sulfite reductase (NADPH) flavoprotein alpha-component